MSQLFASGGQSPRLKRSASRRVQQNSKSLEDQIYSTFIVGEKYIKSDIKTKLRNIYSACSIKSSPKAVDLLKYFDAERCRISVDGKQYEGFKLINRI